MIVAVYNENLILRIKSIAEFCKTKNAMYLIPIIFYSYRAIILL